MLFFAAPAACEEHSSSATMATQVRRLVVQLGDPHRSRRDHASEQLEALGVDVLPLLETPLAVARGEAAWRLQTLRSRLAERAVAEAIEPTRVVAAPLGMTLPEAFEAVFISRGGRLPVDEAAAAGAVVGAPTPASKTSTYWEEVGRLLVAGDCQIEETEASPGGLRIRSRLPGEPAALATAAGPLRVELVRGVAVPPEQPRAVRITLRVLWEPRMRPIMLQLPMASLIAEGEAGEVIPPRQRAAVVEASPRGDAGAVTISVLLAAPTPALETIASLRGTFAVWVPAGDGELRLPLREQPPEAPQQQVGDALVRLESSSLSGKALTVRARADYPASEALASHRTWITGRELACWLDRQLLTPLSDRVVRRDERGLSREAVFALPEGIDPTAVDGQVRWRLPLAILEFPVDFRLQGIPLPYSSDAKNGDSR
jgi:hypothetical protein